MRETTAAPLRFRCGWFDNEPSLKECDMTKQLLAGAAALALLSGAAAAQTLETTRTTTVSPAYPAYTAPADSYTTTKTERTYTPSGATVEREQSYQSGVSGTVSSSQSKVVRPDGSSEVTTRKEWSNSATVPSSYPPAPIPPASTSTTVTTYR
jgi:hypothetical protein